MNIEIPKGRTSIENFGPEPVKLSSAGNVFAIVLPMQELRADFADWVSLEVPKANKLRMFTSE